MSWHLILPLKIEKEFDKEKEERVFSQENKIWAKSLMKGIKGILVGRMGAIYWLASPARLQKLREGNHLFLVKGASLLPMQI